MGIASPAYVTVNPSFTMPQLLLPYSQASGAFKLLATGAPLTNLGEGDQYVYINRIDVRTKMAAGPQAYNMLPSCSLAMSQISTPTYLLRVRAEYDHHDTAAAGRRGISLPEGNRLAMRQGHFQLMRIMLLYGMNPANGEGLLNANGATTVNLPPDSNGDTTATTYDNGEMAFFIASQILNIKTRTNQLGIGRKFAILGPQRTLGLFEYNVVQLVQFQRTGAGTASTKGTTDAILMDNQDELMWCYDDTLINKGAGGNTDAIIIVMPEVENLHEDTIDPNEFARLAPGLSACTLMLNDMVAPREIPTPLPGGAIDILSELRSTSGWGVRPEAVTIVSMQYS